MIRSTPIHDLLDSEVKGHYECAMEAYATMRRAAWEDSTPESRLEAPRMRLALWEREYARRSYTTLSFEEIMESGIGRPLFVTRRSPDEKPRFAIDKRTHSQVQRRLEATVETAMH